MRCVRDEKSKLEEHLWNHYLPLDNSTRVTCVRGVCVRAVWGYIWINNKISRFWTREWIHAKSTDIIPRCIDIALHILADLASDYTAIGNANIHITATLVPANICMPVGDIRMHARRLTQTCDKEYAPFCVHPVENTFSNSSGATHYVASTFFIYLWSVFLFVYSMICHLSNVCTNTVSFRLGSDSNITKIIPISRERSDFFFFSYAFSCKWIFAIHGHTPSSWVTSTFEWHTLKWRIDGRGGLLHNITGSSCKLSYCTYCVCEQLKLGQKRHSTDEKLNIVSIYRVANNLHYIICTEWCPFYSTSFFVDNKKNHTRV